MGVHQSGSEAAEGRERHSSSWPSWNSSRSSGGGSKQQAARHARPTHTRQRGALAQERPQQEAEARKLQEQEGVAAEADEDREAEADHEPGVDLRGVFVGGQLRREGGRVAKEAGRSSRPARASTAAAARRATPAGRRPRLKRALIAHLLGHFFRQLLGAAAVEVVQRDGRVERPDADKAPALCNAFWAWASVQSAGSGSDKRAGSRTSAAAPGSC